ncbi:MAG: hypothetical protein JO079_11165 [Frankiaceae bacterium]|nr:hypothetical protein [Frankiaceae bacterium]
MKRGASTDKVVFESYDDTNFGYLRVICSNTQLRIEYHPSSDGRQAKTPDDAVTLDLASRLLTHFDAPDLGYQTAAAAARAKVRASKSGVARKVKRKKTR